jgi:hypothetical protein
MDPTMSRRSALKTGTIAALGVGLMVAAGAPVKPVAADVPLIDRAETMLVELQSIMLQLDERDRFNLGVNLENMAQLGEVSKERIQSILDDYPLMIGPGNRMWDVMDADDEAERRAAITHAPVVARYASRYHAGGTDAGTAIREELIETYGDDLGHAIARAALSLHLHQKHHDGRDPATCCADA